MFRKAILSFSIILIIVFNAPHLSAITIDLKIFDAFPPLAVTLSADGTSAVLSEDFFFSPVTLEKIDLFIPLDAATLSFDYELSVASRNEDYFDFFIGDLSSPTFWTGGYEGSYAGTYNQNVQAFIGGSIPVVFQLIYGWEDWGLESILKIENVAINPVPEPSSLILSVSGFLICGFCILARKIVQKVS